jgi:FkbM family methyltransferase
MSPEGVSAAGYIRLSTAEQSVAGMTLSEQRHQIEDLAAERGWHLKGVYEDIGAAAAIGARAAYRRLLDELDGIDKIVVARLDRIGQSASRLQGFLERLAAAQVGLVSVAEGLDADAPSLPTALTFLELPARRERALPQQTIGWRVSNLRKPGFSPATVIDVGAGRGTHVVYQAFRDAYHVLVEPLAEFAPELEELLRKHRGELLPYAIGAEDGTVDLNVDPESLLASSINQVTWREATPDNPPAPRTVPLRTVDSLLQERRWQAPFGLKIDTEGFEHRVIEGATELLKETQFVIAEVSVSQRFENSYTFEEFIELMSSRGFALCDILNAVRYSERELSYIDAVFRRAA